MAPKKSLPSLTDLCLKSIESFVTNFGTELLEADPSNIDFEGSYKKVEEFIRVPIPLQARLLSHYLRAVDNLFYQHNPKKPKNAFDSWQFLEDDSWEYSWRCPLDESWHWPINGSWRCPLSDSWHWPLAGSRHRPSDDSVHCPVNDSWHCPIDDSCTESDDVPKNLFSISRHGSAEDLHGNSNKTAVSKFEMLYRIGAFVSSVTTRKVSLNWPKPICNHFSSCFLDSPPEYLCKSFTGGTCFLRKYLTPDINSALQNLTDFSCAEFCSDSILKSLTLSCTLLKKISVPRSKEVTNKGVCFLTQCKKLEIVDLCDTNVKGLGFFVLLLETVSETLFDISHCKYICKALDWFDACSKVLIFEGFCIVMNEAREKSFPLRQLSCEVHDSKGLRKVCESFPNLIELGVVCTGVDLPDFACLGKLEHLKRVKLEFSPPCIADDRLKNFLQIKGSLVTSLNLDAFNPQTTECNIFSDILTFCPNLVNLNIDSYRGCNCSEHTLRWNRCSLPNDIPKPFQKLTSFACSLRFCTYIIQFILKHALNIEDINLNLDAEDLGYRCLFSQQVHLVIDDVFIDSILKENPFNRLKSLVINPAKNQISALMLQRIIETCEQISSLSGFCASSAITTAELNAVLDCIKVNNYDVQLT